MSTILSKTTSHNYYDHDSISSFGENINIFAWIILTIGHNSNGSECKYYINFIHIPILIIHLKDLVSAGIIFSILVVHLGE